MPQKVLFDTDPGCDDAVMLAMALGHPGIEVVGLSTVCGNTTVENTTRNALSILELFGADDVPVARGCDRPIVGDLSTAEHIHGENGIRGDLPAPVRKPIEAHGVDFILEQARKHGEDLVIAAVGPLTNLALALVKDPDLPELVGDVYVMGGAAFTSGNTSPVAEANFHNDPVAARRVVQDAFPKIVGLDVTHYATVPLPKVEAYRSSGGLLETVSEWVGYYDDEKLEHIEGNGPAIHDAAVLADVIDDDVLTFEEYHCTVDTNCGSSNGALLCDERAVLDEPPTAEVAVDIDGDRFRELLFDGIEGAVQ